MIILKKLELLTKQVFETFQLSISFPFLLLFVDPLEYNRNINVHKNVKIISIE